jgi:hypothetical protein
MPAADVRLQRVEKQLLAALVMLRRAVTEAEAFSDQSLADALQEHFWPLDRLHDRLLNGRRVSVRP